MKNRTRRQDKYNSVHLSRVFQFHFLTYLLLFRVSWKLNLWLVGWSILYFCWIYILQRVFRVGIQYVFVKNCFLLKIWNRKNKYWNKLYKKENNSDWQQWQILHILFRNNNIFVSFILIKSLPNACEKESNGFSGRTGSVNRRVICVLIVFIDQCCQCKIKLIYFFHKWLIWKVLIH